MENTTWKTGTGPQNKAYLNYSTVDANGSVTAGPVDFRIKGVCYSPCPIGNDNTVGNNLGDYFWDSFTIGGASIWNWDRLWKPNGDRFGSRRDLDQIAAMGINTIRVYSMLAYQMDDDGTYFKFNHQFTHKSFLDECYQRGIFVLVGFPLPSPVFFKGQSFAIPEADWLRNYTDACREAGAHPAVMGIVFNNELDGEGHSYFLPGNDEAPVQYFWSQIEAMALIAKTNAPGKLVGIALHDAPIQYGARNLPYLNLTEHLDFWGVNTYQTVDLNSLFKQTPDGIGFDNLSQYSGQYPNVYKPVILTEIGWPATGHDASGRIYADAQTEANTAAMISRMIPKVAQESLCLGNCYFEYCDEWWAQPGKVIWEWNGGDPASSFPNKFWDIEGFGLYRVGMNPPDQIPRKADGQPVNWNGDGNGPYPYFNPLSSRSTIDALKTAYGR